MSETSSIQRPKDDIAANIIAAPFIVIAYGVGLLKKVFVKSVAIQETKAAECRVPDEMTIVTFNPTFVVADRTYSQFFGKVKVNFYQYHKLGFIRVVANKNGVSKEVQFTPEIAKVEDVPYSMESAINWVRKIGFAGAKAPSVPIEVAPPKKVVANVDSKPTAEAAAGKVEEADSTPKSKPKTKPFTGTIVSIGEITRPGINGGAAYSIFAIKLRSQYGSFEKEFAGEHLMELASEYDLKKGMLVSLQLLGRDSFTVDIDGKTEKRTRNTFALQLL